MEDDILTPASEDVSTEDQPQTADVPATKESTLEELLDDPEDSGRQTAPESKKESLVPEWKLLDLKNEVKELKKQLKEKSIDTKQFNESTKELLEEYSDVDPGFINKLISVAKEEAKRDLLPELDKIKAQENKKQIESRLNQLLEDSLEKNPDLKDVVNKEVIKSLAMLPQNRNKTMSQLLEETYGRVAEKGTRSFEKPSHNKNKETDFSNLSEDEEREILNDPVSAKKYAQYQAEQIKGLL